MQFPVPQFTEVEDKIIGPLTVKQFGIIFGAGVLIFLAYTVSKSVIVLIFFALLIGLPALGLAFGKLNGRPMYNMMGHFVSFLTSPRVLVFHKQGVLASDKKKNQEENKPQTVVAEQVADPRQRLKDVNRLLTQKSQEEKDLFKK